MILHGDCLDRLKELEASSVDAIVTDPPYGLAFMGKRWDYEVPSVEVWREVLRVLKPGGHALIACGTRTQHRMVVNIEDAGFEIRDVVTWLYGQGFPKSLDISKAIDKAAGAEREKGALKFRGGSQLGVMNDDAWKPKDVHESLPATPAAKQWQGFGTALKPACEFWTLARKPLEGTVAANVQKYGTGGLNIDGCRIGDGTDRSAGGLANRAVYKCSSPQVERPMGGRFPSNLILDEEAAAALDEQSGTLKSGANPIRRGATKGKQVTFSRMLGQAECAPARGEDVGGASRFFYVAKVSPSERNAGLDGMPDVKEQRYAEGTKRKLNAYGEDDKNPNLPRKNHHPTVKPVKLMRYLCRLVTPPGGLVLDPFAGSGSTGVAAVLEGFRFVGIEREAEYVAIAEKRLQAARFEAMIEAQEAAAPPVQPTLFDEVTP